MATSFIEYSSVSIFGFCLVALVVALIASKSFRTDLAAPTDGNMVSIAGLSVQGAVIVVLVALMIGALTYIVMQYYSTIEKRAIANAPNIALSDLPFEVTSKAEAVSKIKDYHHRVSAPPGNTIVASIEALRYNSPTSEDIRNIATNRKGPRGVSDKSIQTFMTVPLDLIGDNARSCPSTKNRKYVIKSKLPNYENQTPEAPPIEFKKWHIPSDDCDKLYQVIHVSCEIAERVLGSAVVTCERNGTPKWKIKDPKIPVYLTEVAA